MEKAEMTNTSKLHGNTVFINPEINYVSDSVPAKLHFIDILEKRLNGASAIASVLAKHADASVQKMPSLIAAHEKYGLLQMLSLELSQLDDDLICHISAMNEYFDK